MLNTAAFWLNAAFHHWPKGFRALSDEIPKPFDILWASLVAQMVKKLPAMQETWVQTLGQ